MGQHPIHRIEALQLVGPHKLRLRFDDGLERVIDFSPVLEGELFGPLRDPDFFAQVSLDPEAQTIVWPNGADFDPATLHDWPDVADELIRRAEEWRRAAT